MSFFDVKWRRPGDPEVQEWHGLLAFQVLYRMRGVIKMLGSVEILSVKDAVPDGEPVRKVADSEWQPIETAPRNEDWCVVGKISDGKLLWWYRAMFWRRGWHTSRSYDTRVEPSHWLPLPDPLEVSDGQG